MEDIIWLYQNPCTHINILLISNWINFYWTGENVSEKYIEMKCTVLWCYLVQAHEQSEQLLLQKIKLSYFRVWGMGVIFTQNKSRTNCTESLESAGSASQYVLLTLSSQVCSVGPSAQQRVAQHLKASGHCDSGPVVWDLMSVRSELRTDRSSYCLSAYRHTNCEKQTHNCINTTECLWLRLFDKSNLPSEWLFYHGIFPIRFLFW